MSDLLLTDPFTLTSIIMSPIIQYVAFSGHKRALAHKHKLFCDTCWKNWGCHSFWEDGFANVYWLLVLARQGPTPFALIFTGPMPLSVCRLWQQNVFSLYIYCENGLFWNNQHLRCFSSSAEPPRFPKVFCFSFSESHFNNIALSASAESLFDFPRDARRLTERCEHNYPKINVK